MEFTDHEIRLNATDPDGEPWHTPTTKLRMNQVSGQYDLGFHVYQKYGSWWVEPKNGGVKMPYIDNMTIKR